MRRATDALVAIGTTVGVVVAIVAVGLIAAFLPPKREQRSRGPVCICPAHRDAVRKKTARRRAA